jgi:hypothetical protein
LNLSYLLNRALFLETVNERVVHIYQVISKAESEFQFEQVVGKYDGTKLSRRKQGKS